MKAILNILTQWFDLCAIVLGRLLAILGLIFVAVFAGAYLLDNLLRRAGYGGLLFDFARQEFQRSPRKFCARMFWGAKQEDD